MPAPPLPYHIAPMRLEDIPQVMAIERRIFSLAWSSGVYRRELTANPWSHYLVMRPHAGGHRPLIGYGGVWQMDQAAHIPTIGLHPDYQGLGLGSCLLLHLLIVGQDMGCSEATLEVRVSGLAAQRLYRRHRFVEVGRRRDYYNDNGEDALIMTREGLAAADLHAELAAAQAFVLTRWPAGQPQRMAALP
ncbi:MAG: ribosomal protein S18-alanine N-acetyltransferase [Caldilineales bacterium]|nr:ribosomal protein S18-alanine N-acetyltransferase [Caldilineales bacterium]